MNIRAATLNDIVSICKLYEEFYSYNAALQPKYYKTAEEKGVYPRYAIENGESEIFVADNDKDEIIGFIHVEKNKTQPFPSLVAHEYVEVIDIIVSKEYRQKGIGSLLMNKAKEWGRALGLDYVELFVLINAEGEKKFYEHESFEITSQTMRCPL